VVFIFIASVPIKMIFKSLVSKILDIMKISYEWEKRPYESLFKNDRIGYCTKKLKIGGSYEKDFNFIYFPNTLGRLRAC
jgi:hypothetical protein